MFSFIYEKDQIKKKDPTGNLLYKYLSQKNVTIMIVSSLSSNQLIMLHNSSQEMDYLTFSMSAYIFWSYLQNIKDMRELQGGTVLSNITSKILEACSLWSI